VVPDDRSGLQPHPHRRPGRSGGLIRKSEDLPDAQSGIGVSRKPALLLIGRPLSLSPLDRKRRSTPC
jgi:hypothetical protein